MKNQAALAKLALTSASLLWGFSFVAVQIAVDGGWTPFLLLGMRGLLAGLIMLPQAIKNQFWKNKQLLKGGFFAGTLMFAGLAFQTYGQNLSTVSNASFITVLYVVFIPVLLWKKQRPKITSWIAIALAVTGTAFLSFQSGFSIQIGDILLIICAILFAYHIIILEKVVKDGDVASVSLVQSFSMSIWGFIASVFTQTSLPQSGFMYVLYAGLISSGLGFFLQLYGQKHVDSTSSGLFLTLESLFGTMAAVLILGEELNFSIILGGSLMMLSVVVLELGPKFVRINRGENHGDLKQST